MVKCPTGLSNSRLYGGNVKSNALGLPGGLIAVGFDSYIKTVLKLNAHKVHLTLLSSALIIRCHV